MSLYGKVMWLLWIAVFLTGMLFFSNHLYKYSIPQQWPSVTGTIIESNIKQGSGSAGSGVTSVSHTTYYPDINYEYAVNYQTFRSSNINYSIKNFNTTKSYEHKSEAENKLEELTKGNKVTVYFNPETPSQSVLINKIPFDAWLVPMIFLLFTLYGLFGLYKESHEKNK